MITANLSIFSNDLNFIFMNLTNKEINIELKEEVAEGYYSNLAIISHSSSEFVVDFIRLMPGIDKARVKSRIIMSPEHAKRLLLSLQENLKKYESNFGEIEIHMMPHETEPIPITPAGEA